MRRRRRGVAVSVALAGALACSSSDDLTGPGQTGWQDFIGMGWAAAAGAEAYYCRRIQLTTDRYLTGFRAAQPNGQRQVIVSAHAGTLPTGNFNCSPAVPLGEDRLLYAAGIGTDELAFPTGVGVRVPAGQYVTLMVHIVNPGATVLTGSANVMARSALAADVTTQADMTFAGTFVFSIPPNGASFNVEGGCTLADAWDVFAVLPLMRQLGTHQAVTRLPSGGGSQVLHDAAFAAANQDYRSLAMPVAFAAGDQLRVTCTYVNNTGAAVGPGDGADDELCLTGIYRTPALANGPLECATAASAAFTPGAAAGVAGLARRKARPS